MPVILALWEAKAGRSTEVEISLADMVKPPSLQYKNWLNTHFSKADIKAAKKHEKMFNINNHQIKANQNHRTYHLRMASIKNTHTKISQNG